MFARGQVALIPPLQSMHLMPGLQVTLECKETGPQIDEMSTPKNHSLLF